MEHMFGVLWFCFLATLMIIMQGMGQTPPGHPHPIPTDDPHLQPAVNFAAAHVNAYCNCANCQTLVGVCNATEQVVSGAIYVFSAKMQESDKCRVDQCLVNVSSTECPPSAKAKPYWCDATVLAKPWQQPPYTLQHLSCRPPE